MDAKHLLDKVTEENPGYSDPTLAAYHAPRQMVFFRQQLTPSGEAQTVRVERPGLNEESKLKVEGHDGKSADPRD